MNKLDAATKSAFGDDMENMLNVVYLATSPEHQGHGYGSALMTAANAEVRRSIVTFVAYSDLGISAAFR